MSTLTAPKPSSKRAPKALNIPRREQLWRTRELLHKIVDSAESCELLEVRLSAFDGTNERYLEQPVLFLSADLTVDPLAGDVVERVASGLDALAEEAAILADHIRRLKRLSLLAKGGAA